MLGKICITYNKKHSIQINRYQHQPPIPRELYLKSFPPLFSFRPGIRKFAREEAIGRLARGAGTMLDLVSGETRM